MCLYIPCGSIESARFTVSEASMSIRYPIESGLLDQLWDASPSGELTRDYGAFIKSRECNPRPQTGPFRIFSLSDSPAVQYIISRPANRDVASDARVSLARTSVAMS